MDEFELVDSDIELLRAARTDPECSATSTVATRSPSSNFAPGTWHLVIRTADNPGYTGSGNIGNTGSGNTVAG